MKHSFSFKILKPLIFSFSTTPYFYFLLLRMTSPADYMKQIVYKLLEAKMVPFILIYSCFSCLDYQVLPAESRK